LDAYSSFTLEEDDDEIHESRKMDEEHVQQKDFEEAKSEQEDKREDKSDEVEQKDDEELFDLKKLHEVYYFENGKWVMSSKYIIDRVLFQYGTESESLVEKFYYTLKEKCNSAFSGLMGQCFELFVVKSIIKEGGLECKGVSNNVLNEDRIIRHVQKVQNCPANESVEDFLAHYNDPVVIYNFPKKKLEEYNEAFDAFIAPNNLLSFTQTTTCRGKHPILLSRAMEFCKEMKNKNGFVNFITVVPPDEVSKWNTPRSFIVNDAEEVKWIQKNEKKNLLIKNVKDEKKMKLPKQFIQGGQRKLEKLSPKTQKILANFNQYVGSIVKRHYSTYLVGSTFLKLFCKR
jgi:hypothetical protein